MKERRTPQELAEITLQRYREDLADAFKRATLDRDSYDGHVEKLNAVFDMFKHCLIFSFDINEYIRQVLLLDPTFKRVIGEVSKDFPEFTIKWEIPGFDVVKN